MSQGVLKINPPGGNYIPVIIHNGIAYVSGQLPRRGEHLIFCGKVGAEINVETAKTAAALCADLCIANLIETVHGMERIVRILHLTGYVASAPGFIQQPQVVDGASDRFIERLGERGRHSRTALGVAELPRGAPVEIEIIAAVQS